MWSWRYADHMPLYRQSQMLARHGVRIERATLAQWVGVAAAELAPLHNHLLKLLKSSSYLFCDETRCPVLDPGRGKTKTGYLWAIVRDDRPWGGPDPPAVVYSYAPPAVARMPPSCSPASAVCCRSTAMQVTTHFPIRRARAQRCSSPTAGATGAVSSTRSRSVVTRRARRRRSRASRRSLQSRPRSAACRPSCAGLRGPGAPIIDALKLWFQASLAIVPKGGKLGEALSYGLNHWDGLVRFLDDGHIEIDSNAVERSIRGLALNRKNALFAGHDLGAEN